ncbi:MAG: SIS domain-containing protein [bacterium]
MNQTKKPARIIDEYYEKVSGMLDRIIHTQREAILRAADIITDSLRRDGILHIFGSGHSHILAEEIYSRAGGLVPVNAMLEGNLMLHEGPMKSTSMERLTGYAAVLLVNARVMPEDSLIIASNSGRNAVPIEMAYEAKKYGIRPIAITSIAHSQSVISRHPSGKRLFEIADVVIDNCGVAGDAAVSVEGLDTAVSPTSTITGAFIVNSIIAAVVENLTRDGVTPPIFRSANTDGSEAHNLSIIQKYSKRIRF